MATAEQWMKCTQEQKNELNVLYSFRKDYHLCRNHMLDELRKARKCIDRTWRYALGQERWIHPVHVRYEAAKDAQRLCVWLNTEGAELAHTIDRLDKAIAEVLREAEQGHEQRQLDLVGAMFPGLTTDEQRRQALKLMKGSKP